ncbi:S8 family peptidase [Lacisediminihabitans changchengi]|uniref:S8 family peptidase n=1 Tax=Lacisediminihabitans changchengi TaxID=2787634 RepID=UPI0027DBA7E4|nr:S8 family peptidase [Lacisediminihabitans changchengi]
MSIRTARDTSRLRTAFSSIAVAGLVAATVLTGGTLSASAAVPTSLAGQHQTTFTPGRYIVTLADPAVATYQGGVNGYTATKPNPGKQLNARSKAVQSYGDYLAQQQKDVAAAAGVTIKQSYTLALNGFSATLSAKQLAALSANKQVASLAPDEIKHVTATPSTSYLGLDGDNGVWDKIGGLDKAGKGIVLGDIDTGIAPENPSFAGEPLGTTAGADPYLNGTTTTFVKADGNTFTGACQTGVQFTAADCSTKIISARYYLDGFGASKIGSVAQGEYPSPRDGDGHGSHTASTAAGDARVPAAIDGVDYGTITGVAPAAKIAVYKVCWSGPDPASQDDDGCATSDLVAAIDQAVADGVDVINYSIGGGAATTTVSPTDQAFLGAAAAGIFVSASAGNSGPTASTLDNAAPWETTVAASTIPTYEATVTLGDGKKYGGASVTVDRTPGATPLTGSLVSATSVALAGAATPNLCVTGSLDPAKASGKIVVCERGVNDRVAKSAEVKRAGGIGMILVNVVPGSTDLDPHTVPTIHLDAKYHDAILAYAATEGATATFTPDNTAGDTPPTPVVAGFSSRGPVLADGSDILKPDITAPGVAIIADGANAEGGDPTFQFLSGTSMAAPHISGLGLLYLGVHPNATPAEIKSAMMTTAYDTKADDGSAVTDPFTQGAGHVDPTKYFTPGLLYLNDLNDWYSYIQGIGYDVGAEPIDASDLNLASIGIGSLTGSQTVTRTVTSTQAGTFTAKATVPGVDVTITPSTLSFDAAGQSKSFTVAFSRTTAPLDEYATGSLTWTSGSTSVRSPIAVQPVTIVAPASASGTGTYGSVDVSVTPGGDGDIPLSTTGLTAGTLQPDAAGASPGHSGSSAEGDSFGYTVTVPAEAKFARFDLDTVENGDDLDLSVVRLDDAGTPVEGWQSATGSADERVDILAPTAGTYVATVDVFAVPTPTAFDLRTYAVADGGAPLTLTPPVLAGTQGVPVKYTASWAGLKPFSSYLGLVDYGDTGAFTAIDVTTKEDVKPGTPVNTSPPTIFGTPIVGSRLTASPGVWDVKGLHYAYQWQANGVAITGATSAKYRIAASDQGKALTAVVTATKGKLPPGTATSAPVTVKFSTATELSLSKSVLFSWQRTTATVKVSSGAATLPAGKVVITLNGKTVTEIAVAAGSPGKVSYELPRKGRGTYSVKATFVPTADTAVGSSSPVRRFVVIF